MLTYSFQSGSGCPLYEQLYRYLREDIVEGKIAGGERLPSKRAFAGQLGVSVITVETAYEQLMAEGYLYAVPRRGFYAAQLGDVTRHRSPVKGEEKADRAAQRIAENTPLFADFSSNQNEPERFPFSIWASLSREMLRDRRAKLMENPPSAGVPELREAIAAHLRSWRGIEVSPEQIIIGAGTDYLYGLLIQLLGFGQVYASEDPGYGKLSRVFGAYHVPHRLIPVDERGLSTAALRGSDARVVHVTPSHHFPTGVTMPAARRYELLAWADGGEGRFILEDDYDSEFRMSGRPLPSLFSMDRAGRVVYINTFTKTLSSTVRVSYMILPPALLQRFERELSFYACPVPVLTQHTLGAFISRGYFEKQLNRMRTASRRKRDRLLKLLTDSGIGDRIAVSEPDAGLHFLMNISMEADGRDFLDRLQERGVHMEPLSAFFHSGSGEETDQTDRGSGQTIGNVRTIGNIRTIGDGRMDHTFLVNYSSVPEKKLEPAVCRIEEALLKSGTSDGAGKADHVSEKADRMEFQTMGRA